MAGLLDSSFYVTPAQSGGNHIHAPQQLSPELVWYTTPLTTAGTQFESVYTYTIPSINSPPQSIWGPPAQRLTVEQSEALILMLRQHYFPGAELTFLRNTWKDTLHIRNGDWVQALPIPSISMPEAADNEAIYNLVGYLLNCMKALPPQYTSNSWDVNSAAAGENEEDAPDGEHFCDSCGEYESYCECTECDCEKEEY